MKAPYFMDQYGYIYRWQQTSTGQESVTVANFQPCWTPDGKQCERGNGKEARAIVDLANKAERAMEALRTIVANGDKIGTPEAWDVAKAALEAETGEVQ